MLVGCGVQTDNAVITQNPIGTPGMNYMIRVNRSGAFDLEIRNGSTIVIDIECHNRFVTQLRTTLNHEVRIHNNVRMVEHVVSTRFNNYAFNRQTRNFRLVLTESQHVRRMDTRYWNQSWLTTVIVQGNILFNVVDGAGTCQTLQALLELAATRGHRAGRANEEPSLDFGLRLEYRSRESRLQLDRNERRQRATAQTRAQGSAPVPNSVSPNVQVTRSADACMVCEAKAETDRNEPEPPTSRVEQVTASAQALALSVTEEEKPKPSEARIDQTLDDDNPSVSTMPTLTPHTGAYRTPPPMPRQTSESDTHPWLQNLWSSDEERFDLHFHR